MAEFLSAEWIGALDEALGDAAPVTITGEPPFVVEQRIDRGTRDAVTYHFVFGGDPTRVRTGSAASPDIVLVTDYETAVALHRGDTNAQRCLAEGHLRVRGNFEMLVRQADAIAALVDAFATVRESTSWPAEDSVSVTQ